MCVHVAKATHSVIGRGGGSLANCYTGSFQNLCNTSVKRGALRVPYMDFVYTLWSVLMYIRTTVLNTFMQRFCNLQYTHRYSSEWDSSQ